MNDLREVKAVFRMSPVKGQNTVLRIVEFLCREGYQLRGMNVTPQLADIPVGSIKVLPDGSMLLRGNLPNFCKVIDQSAAGFFGPGEEANIHEQFLNAMLWIERNHATVSEEAMALFVNAVRVAREEA